MKAVHHVDSGFLGIFGEGHSYRPGFYPHTRRQAAGFVLLYQVVVNRSLSFVVGQEKV